MARALLKAGANTNIHVGDGEEPLLKLVISRGYMDILQAIILHGADVKLADSEDLTALHFAAAFAKVAAINMLVGAGANVNSKVVDVN